MTQETTDQPPTGGRENPKPLLNPDIIPCKGYRVVRDKAKGLGTSLPRRVARLNLGCGKLKFDDCVNLDASVDVKPDVVFNLDHTPSVRLPFDEDTFNSVYMSHILEHLKHPLAVMQELARVCSPNAVAIIKVPYGSSDNAWEDPTHLRPYFLDSFGYFSQAAYTVADYGYRGDWTIVERELRVMADKGLEEYANNLPQLLGLVMTHRNIVDEYKVVLRNVKPIRTPETARESAPISFNIPKPTPARASA